MMAETMIDSPSKAEHGTRKNKKPLMEKRRRARINSCLSQLKSLVLQAIKKDSSQFSKLEKADILELTVKHLRALQRQQAAGVMTQDVGVVSKYRAGFNECAKEVVRYMGSVREMNEDSKERLVGHLAGCLQVVNHVTPVETLQQQLKPLHVHIPQQSVSAVVAGPPPSVIMRNPQQTSYHSVMSFNPAGGIPPCLPSSSSSTAASSECHSVSSMAVSATPLSALPLQHVPVTSSLSSLSPSHVTSSGAFKIVSSNSQGCPTGAVALYLGQSDLHSHPHHHHRADTTTTVTSPALPLQSLSLPAPQPVTAFVTPPLTSSGNTSVMDSPRSSAASVSPVKAEQCSSSSLAALPVDLRQAHKAVGESPGYHVHVPFSQCSPASLAEEKLWRPW